MWCRLVRLCSVLGAIAWLCAAAVPVGVRSARAAAPDPIAVLVSSSSAISGMSMGVLRAAFLNLPTVHEGERLIPLNMPTSSGLRARFDRAVLGLDPDQVGRFWVDQRVRDGRQAPRSVPNADLAMRVAANLKGAIVYVPQSAVKSTRLRVVRLDGKLPGEPGYPLP